MIVKKVVCLLIFLVVIVVIVTVCSIKKNEAHTSNYSSEDIYNTNTLDNSNNENHIPNIKEGKLLVPSDISVGDYLVFGTYEQDNDLSNGPEDIEWLVINVPKYADSEDEIFAISRYVLDCQPYHSTETNTTWETCTLRSWLNNDFLNTAFTFEEQQVIINSEQFANPNPDYPFTKQGNNTYDKVFLLEISDFTYGAFYPFCNTDEILGIPTNYAISKGLVTYSEIELNGRYPCEWWLRTAGVSEDHAATVEDNKVNSHGPRVDVGAYYLDSEKGLGVRPALIIKIEKSDAVTDNVIKGIAP